MQSSCEVVPGAVWCALVLLVLVWSAKYFGGDSSDDDDEDDKSRPAAMYT